MKSTRKFKLYQHKRTWRLHRQINVGGDIWNKAISLHKRYYAQYSKHLNYYLLKKYITQLKARPEYAYWKQLGSQAIQDIIKRVDLGYQKFFRKENKRPPTFRKIQKAKSFTLSQAGWKLLGENKLKIGKAIYKFAKSREIDGTVKRLTIKRDACGDLFAYFSVDNQEEPSIRVETGHTAGLDFGLKQFLTASDGTRYEAPQPLKASLTELKTANRTLSRKKKGSNNRAKAKLKLAKLHSKIRHQREAWHWQLARELCLKYDRIYIEDLLLNGMVRLWGRKMADLGHGNFLRILKHVATKLGTRLQKVDRFFPSSKLCHVCGQKNTQLELSDRIWMCEGCHTVHDRDLNAAKNIHQVGHSTCRVGEIRPALLALAV